jgi:hypothetical protein
VPTFESGRRLCLLFEAGKSRFAVEATSVVEVAPPDLDGDSIRGFLELKDLSVLLGGPTEGRPGIAIVFDVSPTLAVRVRLVVEVVDVARDTLFQLPQGLSEALLLAVRGAVLHGGRLYLEVSSEALRTALDAPVDAWASPLRPIYLVESAPERALVLESQGRLYGVPLAFVSQVVSSSDAFCPLPCTRGPIAGLFPHGQVLWPIYSAPGLLGGEPTREELFVMAELAGRNVGLAATRVLGVHSGFQPAEARGEFTAKGLEGPALFLDLQRMFS